MPRGRGEEFLAEARSFTEKDNTESPIVDFLDQEGMDAYHLSLEYDLGNLNDIWTLLKSFTTPSQMNGFRCAVWSTGDDWERPLLVQFLIDTLPEDAIKDIWLKDRQWLGESGHWQTLSTKQQEVLEEDTICANYVASLMRAKEGLPEGLARNEAAEALEACLEALDKGETASLDVYPLELALADRYIGEHEDLFEAKCQEADALLKEEGIESGSPERYLLHPSFVALAANCAGLESPESVNLSHGRYTHKSHSIIVADEERTLLDQTVCHETLHAAQSFGEENPSDHSHPELGKRYEKAAGLLLEGVTSTFAGGLTGNVDGISQEYVIAGLAALDMVEERPGLSIRDIAPLHPRKMIAAIGEHLFPGEKDQDKKVINSFFDACQRYNMDSRIDLSCVSPSDH